MPNFRSIELSDPRIPVDGLRFATLKSPALRQRADVTWYATPGAETATDLPIVVLLHGVYGSHWAWAMKGDAHRTAAAHKHQIRQILQQRLHTAGAANAANAANHAFLIGEGMIAAAQAGQGDAVRAFQNT